MTTETRRRLDLDRAMLLLALLVLFAVPLWIALTPSPTHEPTPAVTVTTEPETAPTYSADDAFAAIVVQNGVADRDVNLARSVAQSMCVYLTAGDTIDQAKAAALDGWTYGPRPTAAVIGSAALFCPQHTDALNDAAHLGVDA